MHLLIFVFISITLPEIKTKEIDYISIEIINEKVKEGKKETKEVKEVKEVKKFKVKPSPPKQKPLALPKKKISVVTKKANIEPKPPQKKPKIIPPKEKIDNSKDKNNDDFFDDMLKNLAENQPKPIKPIKPIKNKTNTKPKKTKEEIKRIQKSISNIIY